MANETENKLNQAAKTVVGNTAEGIKAMQDAAALGTERMQTAAQTAAQAGVQQLTDASRRSAEAGMAGMAEFSKLFGEMKWPMMPDMEALMNAHRRNMETLSNANRVALEGAQSVAKRHMEIVGQTVQEMSDTIRELSSTESPQNRAAKQAELVKHSYERAVTHMRELAELIQRANGEALQMLNRRFAEAMDEVKTLAEKSGRNA